MRYHAQSLAMLAICVVVYVWQCSVTYGHDVSIRCDGAEKTKIVSTRPDWVIIEATGKRPIELRIENLKDTVYHIEWYDLKSKGRIHLSDWYGHALKDMIGSAVVSPSKGRVRATCPATTNGLLIRAVSIEALEHAICRSYKAEYTRTAERFNDFITTFESTGKMELALAEYDRIIRFFPRDSDVTPGAYIGKAMALMKLKRYDQALKACDDFVERYRNETALRGTVPLSFWCPLAAHSARAEIYEDQRKWDLALNEHQTELDILRGSLTEASYPPGDYRHHFVPLRDKALPERIARMKHLLEKGEPLRPNE